MKYTINKLTSGEEELILNYVKESPEIEKIISFMQNKHKKICGKNDGETVIVDPEEILYIETVDDKTFAYTMDKTIRLEATLAGIQKQLEDVKFFRCSKSMIVNVDRVERLKSLPSNRIDAVIQSGEHIMISRTYASEFRRLLREVR